MEEKFFKEWFGIAVMEFDQVAYVGNNIKNHTIPIPLGDEESVGDRVATACNRFETTLHLYPCVSSDMDGERENQLRDNVDELEAEIRGSITVTYVSEFQFELVVDDNHVLIVDGELTDDGLLETNSTNLCDNPETNIDALVDRLVV